MDTVKQFEKIDPNGEYNQFLGVSIIANVQQDNGMWKDIYTSLSANSVFTNYFTPLPYQSYHMTTCNLYTENHKRWPNLFTELLTYFQLLHYCLKETPFNPTVKIKNFRLDDVLQLELELSDDHRQLIQDFASSYDMLDGIPDVFHITLAYNYKNIPANEFEDLNQAVSEILKPLLDKEIQLNPPTLCYFKSMKEFIPWNAHEDPFKKPTGVLTKLSGVLSCIGSFFGNCIHAKEPEESNKSNESLGL